MSAADQSAASASDRVDEDGNMNAKHERYEQKIEQLDNEIDKLVRDQLANGSEDDKSEFLRKRNALYSQRKYYRKKMRIDKLETEQARLMQENSRLRRETEMLERILTWAREKVFLHEAPLTVETDAPRASLPPSFHPSVLENVGSANSGIVSRSFLERRQEQTSRTLPIGLGTRSSFPSTAASPGAQLAFPTAATSFGEQLSFPSAAASLEEQLAFPSTAASLGGLSGATGDNLTTSALLAAIESNQRARNDLLLRELVARGGTNPLAASLDGSGLGNTVRSSMGSTGSSLNAESRTLLNSDQLLQLRQQASMSGTSGLGDIPPAYLTSESLLVQQLGQQQQSSLLSFPTTNDRSVTLQSALQTLRGYEGLPDATGLGDIPPAFLTSESLLVQQLGQQQQSSLLSFPTTNDRSVTLQSAIQTLRGYEGLRHQGLDAARSSFAQDSKGPDWSQR